MTRVYAIEGLDRLGKSTLIEGIQNRLGFHQLIHFGKPRKLDVYSGDAFKYQRQSFIESMLIANSKAHVIFDRWHLGEAVYSPIYRGYDGDYVFELERQYLDSTANIRLILLCEDFMVSKHFVSDGDSFDDSKRREEQQLFVKAFMKSKILDKRIIGVTDPDSGQFKSPQLILEQALA